MPELILILVALTTLFLLPLISGLFAKRMGRKFWPWFFLGCLLPMVSVFILFLLPEKTSNT